jgi:hypothetical protein
VKTLELFGTSACHLCEVAEAMLAAQLAAGGDYRVVVVDISESDELFARYGTVIPVLRRPDGRELNWPFGDEELGRFLRE